MKDKLYTYRAKIIDVYDGDTFTVQIDLGFKVTLTDKVRLYGIDTPEIRTKDKEEKKRGYTARKYLLDMVLGHDCLVKTHKQEKYGRILADVTIVEDGVEIDLATEMIKNGHGKAYFGGKR